MSIRPLLVCLGVMLFAAAMLYLEAPGLMRDVQLRNATLVPARDLKVEEAKCTTHWWLVSNCSIKYVAPQARTRESINFSVFGTLGGERFQLMRTPDNRAVTTDIGIAKLTNRITMAIVLLIAITGTFYVSFRKAIA
jgi:hypothetical protein